MNIKSLLAASALMLAMVTGCEKKPVAVVNGDRITEKMLQGYIDQKIMEHGSTGVSVTSQALRSAALQQIISERLLLQGAKEKGISISNEDLAKRVHEVIVSRGKEAFDKDLADAGMTIKDFEQSMREKLNINMFISSLVPDDAVTEEDLIKYYHDSPVPFMKDEQVFLRFVEINDMKKSQELVDRIKTSKGDFDSIVEKEAKENQYFVSEYGWTSPSGFAPEMSSAMKSLAPGKFAGPIKGKDGYFIIRIKDRKPAGVQSFDEAKGNIREMLIAQERQNASIHWVASKKKSSKITIY